MKVLIFLAVVVAYSEAQLSMNNPQYCYSTDPIRPQNGMHLTWSNYEAVRRIHVDPTVSACTPNRFWFVSRYGGDLPDRAKIQRIMDFGATPILQNITDNYNQGKTTLCAQDFQLITSWVLDPNITLDSAELLTVSGWNIMEGLGRRWQERYPTLLPSTYNQQTYFFRSAHEQRSVGSIRAVADGLFGPNGHQGVVFEPIPFEDTLLRPHDHCPAYLALQSNREEEAFRMGPEYRAMITNVNYKLGFFEGEQLPWTTVETMYDICRFEKSENLTIPSEWCAAFSIHDSQVLEFLGDCDYYYRNGYGTADTRLLSNLNCGLMQDLLRFLTSTATNEPTARFFSTHDAVMQLLAVSFHIFDDEIYDMDTLTRHNIAQVMTRLWRTSWISPKGANLVAVRYDCAGGDNDVVFFWNERPIQLPAPGCGLNGLCKINQVVSHYQRFLDANCPALFCSSN
jgi:multiple inositol-polyphosphate phosphatase/2,3-bisphosphoglycerate 3-phosphatase